MSRKLFVALSLLSCVCSVSAESPSDRFAKLIQEEWEFRLAESPQFATSTGDRRFNHMLGRLSTSDADRRNTRHTKFLESAQELLPQLRGDDRLNARIFIKLLEHQIAGHKFAEHLTPITNREGFHISFPELAKQMPMESTEDYQNYIARLGQFRRYAADHIHVMREGLKQGYTLPSIVLTGYRAPLDGNIVEDETESRLFDPFRSFPETVPEADRSALVASGRQAIRESVVPGYKDFLKFMSEEYVPASRDSIAASALPNGREYYRFCTQKFTTLDILPEEVHEIGKREVARIRSEMMQIIRNLDFKGDFAEFVEHLRTDPQFYATTPEELLRQTSYVLKRIDGELPKLFRTLPRTPYGIRVIPDYIAPQTTTAYYQPPRGAGEVAGFYYVNTYNLKSRPLYGVEALSHHEAVPGHHLQIALQQELDNLPEFRRYAGFTAFVEGWALYAERLGLEMGFYTDPYSDFGRLTYEMWRACRLVVDTGIHYLGWSRSQAIQFMEANSALSKHNIRAEVDRYIAWPGQALGYKMGELKIRELRELAETSLGDRFDIRKFHDVVLLSGAVPLDILESQVEDWIESQL